MNLVNDFILHSDKLLLVFSFVVLVFGALFFCGAFSKYKLLSLDNIAVYTATAHFHITYTYQRFPGSAVQIKTLKCYAWDGDVYIDDGYATPLIWVSDQLADAARDALMSRVQNSAVI